MSYKRNSQLRNSGKKGQNEDLKNGKDFKNPLVNKLSKHEGFRKFNELSVRTDDEVNVGDEINEVSKTKGIDMFSGGSNK